MTNSGVADQVFQVAAQRPEIICADIVGAALSGIDRQHIEIYQVIGVNELELYVATADDVDIAVVLDPFE